MGELIGREKEKQLFDDFLVSKSSEFIVVYGRRRVGKTFLIREVFENKFHFQLTGLANATLKQQLANFNVSLQKNYKSKNIPLAKNWFEAFQLLISHLEKIKDKKKNSLYR